MKKTLLALTIGQAGLSAAQDKKGECPFGHSAKTPQEDTEVRPAHAAGTANTDWWPNQLQLDVLRQNAAMTSPMSPTFDYAKAFAQLDFPQLKADISLVLTTSQDWWPADFGNYGPLFIRMAWHSAGTYRTADGRGGTRMGLQRFAPLNSWPDNVNLDKARRLLWPIKQKYGAAISWADLMILAGNVALENMGFATYGFAGGRQDVYEAQKDIYWGTEKQWLHADRRGDNGQLENPLAAVQMGLIYVNPEGPNGIPDPLLAAHDIRATFERMGMNDEETVALIAGGHSFGKSHGQAAAAHLGPEPEAAPLETMGFGWNNTYQTGMGRDAITSGLEVTWTATPTQWGNGFFRLLFKYEWQLTKSPAGAHQWEAITDDMIIPDAFDRHVFHKPTMLTTDLSLRFDPSYEKISRHFLEHPEDFQKAFAKAWFKLTHRDMGPKSTYLGPEVPQEDLIWQDPLPVRHGALLQSIHITDLKKKIAASGLTIPEMVGTAWAAASTYRHSDRRGGANGARIQLLPQREWEVNNPQQLTHVLETLRAIQQSFHTSNQDVHVSMADLIVLSGNVGIELAAKNAGYTVEVPFTAGRTDATQEWTDIASFDLLRPMADGFRNYQAQNYTLTAEQLLIDRAQQLTLTAPEMTVLVGGLRAMHCNYDGGNHGCPPDQSIQLSNVFFTHLLDMKFEWKPRPNAPGLYDAIDRTTHETAWSATRADLIFGAHSELRALAEVYASNDYNDQFVQDFIHAWVKVMNLDRFDLPLR